MFGLTWAIPGQEGAFALHCKGGQETQTPEQRSRIHWHQEKKINEMIHNDSLLYPWISALSIDKQYMGAGAETQIQTAGHYAETEFKLEVTIGSNPLSIGKFLEEGQERL